MSSKLVAVSVLSALVGLGATLGGASIAAAESVTVTLTTTPKGGNYAPRNIVAVWIEGPGGVFQKTIGRWAGTRKSHLSGWLAKAGNNDADAITGATRQNHTAPLTVTWDFKNKAGAAVPNGAYTVRMELADSNSSTPAQNNQGTFTFQKNGTSSSTTGGSNGGFVNVAVNYVAGATSSLCNNGTVDAGEICDGNCPTSCAAPADACAASTLTGSAATCNAQCVTATITTCVDGDGCCAAGCDAASDSDCADLGPPTGGCNVTPPNGAPLMLLLGAVGWLGLRRRRV
jgi:MYXO-CTERM domain-containing protein